MVSESRLMVRKARLWLSAVKVMVSKVSQSSVIARIKVEDFPTL